MIRSTFYPNLISSKMMSRKFRVSNFMAYLHKCPLNNTLPYGRSDFQRDFFCNSYWRFRFRSRKNTINWTYPNSPSVFWFLSYLTHFFWENWKKKDSLGSFLQGIWICNQNCKKITLKISPPPKEWAFVVVRHLARGMKISALHLWWSQFWIKCRPSHDRAKCTFLDQVPNHGTKKNWTSIHSQ